MFLGLGFGSVVECLPSKLEGLGSVLSTKPEKLKIHKKNSSMFLYYNFSVTQIFVLHISNIYNI